MIRRSTSTVSGASPYRPKTAFRREVVGQVDLGTSINTTRRALHGGQIPWVNCGQTPWVNCGQTPWGAIDYQLEWIAWRWLQPAGSDPSRAWVGSALGKTHARSGVASAWGCGTEEVCSFIRWWQRIEISMWVSVCQSRYLHTIQISSLCVLTLFT